MQNVKKANIRDKYNLAQHAIKTHRIKPDQTYNAKHDRKQQRETEARIRTLQMKTHEIQTK